MANRLAREKSPYLLQHADNPVDWHPWGEEAFARAQEEDKPVFLSIGYATCHWCHVMAHESFEDPQTAEMLNRDYIAIKVDREERPDIDGIYMTVCQALTGQGGWPLTVFLSPDKKPFFAGTYFPKHSMPGRPGFKDLLAHIARMWREERGKLIQAGDEITQAIRPRPQGQAELSLATLEKAYWALAKTFDPKRGGFGQAPKFPTPHHLTFLLRWHLRQPESKALEMVEGTLAAMRAGGICDQVGLGFHRYSVDERWLVPHFEKMLYDQALLALAYLEAFQVTGKQQYADSAREIFSYVLRDMTAPEGGFYSAEDADSEGEEGLFYVWTPEQVKEVLGEELGGLFNAFYGISPAGNFEGGRSIPHVSRGLEDFAAQRGADPAELAEKLARAREMLRQARLKRVPPLKDDKVLAAWNGLMIAALAKGAMALGEPAYLQAAEKAADFVLENMRDHKGRLMRRWRQGEIAHPGFLDDYAFVTWGLVELYLAGLAPGRLAQALEFSQTMLDAFGDELHGGFFYTPHFGEEHIIRDKEIYDGALPSGNSVAAYNLLRLARLTGRAEWEERAWKLFKAFSGQVAAQPMAYAQMLIALDFALGPSREVVLAAGPKGGGTQDMLRVLHQGLNPRAVWLLKEPGPAGDELAELAPFSAQMAPLDDRTAAYICHDFTCERPVSGADNLRDALRD